MSQIKLKYNATAKTSLGTKVFRAVLVLVFLLLVGYFVLSSSWFLQAVVVPRVGKALNSTLNIGQVELRPFNEITLSQVKLTPQNADTLFEARRVHVSYHLLSILRGNIQVQEVVLDSPVITIVEDANGRRNLDAVAGQPASTKTAARSGTVPKLDFKLVSLRNATIRHARTIKNGDQVTTELANVNLAIKDIRNGGSGTLTLSAALAMEKVTATPPAKANLPALLNGDLAFTLREDLQPASIKGLSSFTVGRATGEFAELGGLIAKLDCEMSPDEIKQFALQFTKGNVALGRVRVTGPFDTAKTEGKLKLEVQALDRQVLNLLGASRGIDFGTTTINGTTDITIAQGGRMISPAGRVDVARFQTIQRGLTSPTIDLICTYDLTLDRTGKSLLLKSLVVNGTQNQQPLVNASLSSPLTLAFGDTVNAADASLDFAVTGLNLADWPMLAPGLNLAGMASSKGRLFSRDGGKRINLEIEETVKNFSASLGGGPTAVEDVSFKGTINHTAQGQTINSTLTLTGIKLAGTSNPLELALGLDAAISNQVVTLNQCQLKLTPTARARNELAVTGLVNLTQPDAITGNLKLTAESLDISGYYDLFAGNSTGNNGPSPAPAAPKPATNQEPAPVRLPLSNFTVEATLGRLYLHEVDAANFQTTLLLDGSHILLNPFQLTLNKAPVSASADLDLSVPGYKYALTFGADGVPVEPLANTFSPTYRGQAKGTLIAKLDVKGAGITGQNLRTNLIGNVNLSFTNADIQITRSKWNAVLVPVSVLLMSFGAPDLTSSPLDHITASLAAGDGKLTVPTFVAQSPLFRAESTGSIPIADNLMDSPLNQPVEISLPRDLAAKLGVAEVSTNEPYAKLPNFVQLNGTLGKPGSKTDKAKLGGLAAVGIGTAILKNVDGETGQKIGSALNALGGLLGGRTTATNTAPASTGTNAAPTRP